MTRHRDEEDLPAGIGAAYRAGRILDDRRTGDDRRDDEETRRKGGVNWSAVGVIAAVAISILSWFGSGFSDYRKVNDRVLTLENQRVEDRSRMERIESKLDRLLERPAAK